MERKGAHTKTITLSLVLFAVSGVERVAGKLLRLGTRQRSWHSIGRDIAIYDEESIRFAGTGLMLNDDLLGASLFVGKYRGVITWVVLTNSRWG